MQVYMVFEKSALPSSLDEIRSVDVFRNFGDIEDSIRISWSKAINLKVEKVPTSGIVEFHISGVMPINDGPDVPFSTILVAVRFPVWDSPTHL